METHFASPQRLGREEIASDIQVASCHPIIDEVMKASNGLFAVLNEHRQIVAINDTFLESMGIENAAEVMGLRFGEYIKCDHSHDMPGGCGTSRYCSTCGAAISAITALESMESVEKKCIITTERDYKDLDLYFNVRCHPINLDGKKYLLLFMQDVSIQQQWAYLENTFLHDLSNTVQGLVGTSQILTDESKVTPERLTIIRNLSMRVAQEVAIQKTLSNTMSHSYSPIYNTLSVRSLLDELRNVLNNHPSALKRTLTIRYPEEEIQFLSDHVLVSRILINMAVNALEATDTGGNVNVYLESDGDALIFCVHNASVIPAETALRIFQRNYSTKEGFGHGLGTYSMKLFGEKILGGKVSFTSTQEEGTVFRFALQHL